MSRDLLNIVVITLTISLSSVLSATTRSPSGWGDTAGPPGTGTRSPSVMGAMSGGQPETAKPAATMAPKTTPAAGTTDWPHEGKTQGPLFYNEYERDRFIMKMSSEMADIKGLLLSVLGGGNSLTTPSSGGSSSFVAFTARLSSMLTNIGYNQIILFDDVILNKGKGYDTRLGVFRCPVAGTYQFSVSIGAYGSNELEIVNNGQEIAKVFTSSRHGRDAEDTPAEIPKDESQFQEKKEEDEDEEGEQKKRYLTDDMYTNDYQYGYPGYNSGYYYTSPGYGYGYGSTYRIPNSHLAVPGSAQVIVELKVGDEVWVRHSSGNPRDVLFGDGMTVFSGTLLGRAK